MSMEELFDVIISGRCCSVDEMNRVCAAISSHPDVHTARAQKLYRDALVAGIGFEDVQNFEALCSSLALTNVYGFDARNIIAALRTKNQRDFMAVVGNLANTPAGFSLRRDLLKISIEENYYDLFDYLCENHSNNICWLYTTRWVFQHQNHQFLECMVRHYPALVEELDTLMPKNSANRSLWNRVRDDHYHRLNVEQNTRIIEIIATDHAMGRRKM